MGQALIVLEKHGIIHRDIKGKNIFISIDGSFKLGIKLLIIIIYYLFFYKATMA
jgi:serine/threonine protein kinase